MRNFIFIALVFAAIVGCNSQKTINQNSADARKEGDTVRIANDSLQYEIIIIDPGFNGWLAGRAYPRNYHSQTYLENKNRMWVSEWNIRARNPLAYRNLYDMQIDYDPHIDYGYEVNYMLYNYLVYFQNKYNQRLGGYVPPR